LDGVTVDPTEIRKMAELARLELTDREVADLARDAGRILEAVRDLSQVALGDALPTFGAPAGARSLRLRPDVARPGLDAAAALADRLGEDRLVAAGGVGVEKTAGG
jgi:aspartyl-tRNA(Asn)/glutamyl-tRNA(Gln) amidotransferase subunit C